MGSPVAHYLQDHFYVCIGHLKDKGFASPIIDPEEAVAKKRKEELDREVELVKKEYEEKMKKKKGKKKDKEANTKDKEKDDTEKEQENDDDAKAEKEKDDKVSINRPLSSQYLHVSSLAKSSTDQSYHQQTSISSDDSCNRGYPSYLCLAEVRSVISFYYRMVGNIAS